MGVVGTLSRARLELAHESSRLLWGNDAWAENNVGQQRLLRRRRADPAVTLDQAGLALADTVVRQGYAVLDPRCRAGLVDEVARGYAEIIGDPSATVDMGGRIKDAVRYVIDPLCHVPAIQELLTPPVLSALDAYYGGRWRVQHVRMWRISHLTEEQRRVHHYGNLWHCDQHPTSTLKYFVQLSDGVTAEGGAFRLHSIPNTRRIMRSGYLGQGWAKGPARALLDDPALVVPFDAPKGYGAFCNTTRCLHRAGIPPLGTTRGMTQFTFVPADTPNLSGDPFHGLKPDPNVAEGRYA